MIEKWCYFFKYASSTSEEEVRKIIDSDLVIQRAYEALNRFNWSEEELRTYEQEIKRIMDNQAVEDYMKKKARQEGREEGKLEIAKSMLAKGYPIEDIISITGLSKCDIQNIV